MSEGAEPGTEVRERAWGVQGEAGLDHVMSEGAEPGTEGRVKRSEVCKVRRDSTMKTVQGLEGGLAE